MVKTVYLEPPWKPMVSSEALIKYPPQGYQFIAKATSSERLFSLASKTNLAYAIRELLDNRIPLYLFKSYLERFKHIPQGADLTYAISHLVLRKEPWVLDIGCEQPYLLLGHEQHMKRFKGALNRILSSSYCKRIICFVEAGKKSFLEQLDNDKELEKKIEVVYVAVPEKCFVKERPGGKIKLLFINSANINQARHFEAKGGKETIEAFLGLQRRYDNLELVIRSGMSREMQDKCRQIKNIRVIDKPVSWDELEQEWKTADIFVLPTHVTPAVVFMDAMSYELPVVTTGVWANSEMVADGRTGFLVPKSAVAEYCNGSVVHLNSREYERVVKNIDPLMVQALVEKLSALIENEGLRREMGRAGRWEVEHGKFSIKQRNEKLKKIFDEVV